MSKFRYVSFNKQATSKPLDLKWFKAIGADREVVENCDKARACHEQGDKEGYQQYKDKLPMAFWLGYNDEGKRAASKQTPTQYFYIDIDHAKATTKQVLQHIMTDLCPNEEDIAELNTRLHEVGIRLVHETPSGGVRIVVLATQDFTTVEEHLKWFVKRFGLEQFGDIDYVVKDFARGSFMVKNEWIHYLDERLFDEVPAKSPIISSSASAGGAAASVELPEITEKELNYKSNGVLLSKIAGEYVIDQGGVPEEGKRHAFYNELVKNFRNLCDSDPRVIFAVLPLCEGTPEKRWSQCTSICKTNNTSLLPKDFYFWLKKRGYVTSKKDEPIKEILAADIVRHELPPCYPPVFREFCNACPPDFVYPTVIALLPVMGTLASYVRSEYMDMSVQSTTFFSCIYAPPSSYKSFAGNIVDMLLKKVKVRDEMNSLREQLWLVEQNTKADNEKGKDLPHVMVRIMPPINSLPEFLEKMRDNKGYHMFTFAEEVDTFAKGSKAGGSDKSDLFRTAWDNKEYGQSFRSNNTFKGVVKIYYNILLTGTNGAVTRYYSNVEDGMVTRISICEIENQKYAKFQAWKRFSKKQMEVIDKFISRCDENTYRDPCEMQLGDALVYTDNIKDYDENVKWRFTMKEKQKVDMSWLFPTILEWLEKKRIEASLSQNDAMDVFRRRAGVKGFRVGLLSYCCWDKVKDREKAVIKKFVRWFMDRDLEESLKMFGTKYNELQASVEQPSVRHNNLFTTLESEFTKNDVITACMKQGIRSKVSLILHRWKEDKAIEQLAKDTYKKTSKYDTSKSKA